MGEVIVTLILVGFVVGGGLFVFWPSLTSFITKPKKEKKKKKSIQAIYETHMPKEEELLEAHYLVKHSSKYQTIQQALKDIDERGRKIKLMMESPQGGEHKCPMCRYDNTVYTSGYPEVRIRCGCGRDHIFSSRVQKMMKEMGYRIW